MALNSSSPLLSPGLSTSDLLEYLTVADYRLQLAGWEACCLWGST